MSGRPDMIIAQRTMNFPLLVSGTYFFLFLSHSDTNEECSVLELGIGTGMLTTMYADIAKDITGVDFSPKMVERCKTNVPGARIFQADVTKPFDFLDGQKFDRVISNYLFHEFCDETKLQIIERCFGDHIKEAGFMVIGDISFENRTKLDECRNRNLDLWDDDEFYWDADVLVKRISDLGYLVSYSQISECAWVYVIKRKRAQGDSDP